MIKYPYVIHWRQTILARNGRCECGAKLWDVDEGTTYLEIENKPLAEKPVCKCRVCGAVVAEIRED